MAFSVGRPSLLHVCNQQPSACSTSARVLAPPARRVVCGFASRQSRPQLKLRAATLNIGFMPMDSVDPGGRPPSLNSVDMPSGTVFAIHGAEELRTFVDAHPEKLVVLMCKAKACRPCKMMTRKYVRLASRFPEVVLLEIMGDESQDTRRMMMDMQVKVTPTFRMYRHGSFDDVTGANEKKLLAAVMAHLSPAEQAAHPEELAELEQPEQEEQQQS